MSARTGRRLTWSGEPSAEEDPVKEAAEAGEACGARKTWSVAVVAKLWWEQSGRLTGGRGEGAGSTAAGVGEAAADAAPPACKGEREEEEDDPTSEACRERGGQSQAKQSA